MKKFISSILLTIPWMFTSAQTTTLDLGFETQDAFESEWTQIGIDAQWTWLNYNAGPNSYVPVAQWQAVSPFPEKGTILAYKTGLNMKAGTGTAKLNVRVDDRKRKAFEILIATDAQFNNIVATVGNSVIAKSFTNSPIGNQYQPNSFTISSDGTYYVGFRCVAEYDGDATTEGNMMVRYLTVSYDEYEEVEPENVISLDEAYTNALGTAEDLNGYTIDPSGWQTGTGYMYLNGGGNAAAVSTLNTPAFAMEEGVTYEVSFDAWVSSGTNHYMALKAGATREGMTAVGEQINVTSNSVEAPHRISFQVTGNAEGKMYLGIEGTAMSRSTLYMNNLRVEKYVEPEIVISLDEAYTNALGAAEDLNGYTIDPSGWQTGSGYMFLNGGGNAAAVSTLNTPAFAMEEGVTYEVSFDAWAGSGTNHYMALKAGATREGMTAVGEQINVTSNSVEAPHRISFQVTGNAEGKMYLGIEGTAMSRSTLYMNNLRVEKYVEPEIVINLDEAYTNALGTAEDLNGYTIDPSGWQTGTGYMFLNGGGNAAAVSTLNTPAFAMEEGVTYEVSFDAWAGSGTKHYMALKAGATREGMTAVGEQINVTSNSVEAPHRISFQVTGNAEGKMYLGIEGTAMSRSTLYMNNLRVEKYVEPEIVISLDEAYTNALGAAEDLNGYTIDPSGWQTGSGYMFLNGGGNAAAVSTLNTPAFAMEEGVTYEVSFDAWAGSGTKHYMALKAGATREGMTAVGEQINVTSNSVEAPHRISFQVTGNAEGKMYLGIEGTAMSRSTLYMNNLRVEKYVEPEIVISLDEAYTNALGTAEDLNGYTIDPSGWQTGTGYMYLNGGGNAAAVSTLNTPAFAMEEGVTYEVSFDAWVSSGTNHYMALKAGASREGMTAVGEQINVTSNSVEAPHRISFQVTGNAEGKMYLGIEGTAMSRATLYMNNLRVEKYVEPEIVISLDEAYTNTLGTAEDINGYTIDPSGWQTGSGYMFLNGGGNAAAVSTLNTPAFAMEEGVTYEVSFDAWAGSGTNHYMALKAGASREGMTAVGEQINVTSNSVEAPHRISFQVTGNAEGKMYLGIEGTAMSRATLYMNNLRVEKYVPQPVITLGEIQLDATTYQTHAVLAVAASEVIGENLGEATVALYYSVTAKGSEAESEDAFTAMSEPTENDANYRAEISYAALEPGEYTVTVKAVAMEGENVVAQDVKAAGEFAYSPTLTMTAVSVSNVTETSFELNIEYTGEYLPENAVVKAVLTEASSTESQTYELGASPATVEINALVAGAEYKFSVTLQTEVGSTTITSNTEEITIQTSGISEVAADVANGAKYFNLQGREVRNPAAGVYIRIMNGKSQKVIVKSSK